MRLAPVEVYEVASFYHHFDVVKEGETPPPALTVRVCDSVSCELAGAEQLIPALEQELGPTVRVQRVPCVGRCETAPVAVVGQNPIGTASLERVRHAIEHRATQASLPANTVDYPAYRAAGGYQVLGECLNGSRDVDSILRALEDSGLRGLGGAGFPAGRKWRIVRGYAGPRLLAVNIDEGEPGTFKDRYYLERDPHRFLEGMLIAAWAAEINAVYIYIRDEYPACLQILKNALAALEADPRMALPAIYLRRGAGAYICGEESGMIESIEGKRGMPRLRPPYVAEVGLFGRPTLEHNFETLYWVRDILERGAEWVCESGPEGAQGAPLVLRQRSRPKAGGTLGPGRHQSA